MAEPARAAPAHPLVLAAAALIVVNDFVLRGHAPGWLTGKLSDVGWLVVAPVLVAALASWLGAASRAARAAGLTIAGAFYVALQVWPPLGAWIRPGHVADLGDLLVLPALLGALVAWRTARPARWPAVAALPALGGVLLADDYALFAPVSAPCGDEMAWDASVPLQVTLAALSVPYDTDAFLRGLRLTDADGVDVPLVAAPFQGSTSSLVVCARHGLRGDTDYTWEIGPWEEPSSNEVAFVHGGLPTVRFRTRPGGGPAAPDIPACEALGAAVSAPFDRCADTGADTGPADTGGDETAADRAPDAP